MKILATPKMLLSVLLLAWSVQSANAACRDDIPASTPSSDFTVHNNGTVTHTTTGLMWMRCRLGQSWDGSSCSGSTSTYTWANALAAAQSHEFGGYSDWRLPNKNELESIVEERCVSPAINTAIFPGTPSSWFWSSSPHADGSAYTWGVVFNGGYVDGYLKNFDFRVRLVRAGQ
ncbi:Lcl C-terminal domain-containing protein [Arsukibacterium sp.]|uniref:Lcl C-terminal domain-containing protein n=1 Tax=Arsukibacterium sp. TaxID=1977258 RepID=UPI002FD8AFB8